MAVNPEPIHLIVRPLPSDHSLPELKPAYVKLDLFCPTCHEQLTTSSWCTSCFANQDDSMNSKFQSKRHQCSFPWCKLQTDSKLQMDQHMLIDHPDLHAKKRKRKFEEFDEPLRKYYKRSHINSISKHWATSQPINTGVRRNLNQKAEPDLLDSIKEVVDISKFYSEDDE